MKRILLSITLILTGAVVYSQDLKLHINKVALEDRAAPPSSDGLNYSYRNWVITINNSLGKLIVDFDDGKDEVIYPIVRVEDKVSNLSDRIIHRIFYKKRQGGEDYLDYIVYENQVSGAGMFYFEDSRFSLRISYIERL